MLDVAQSRELQAIVLTLHQAERATRNDLNKRARQELKPVWQQELAARAKSKLDRRVILPGARVAVSATQVALRAAGSTRPLGGGLVPSTNWPAVELGMNNQRITYTSRSPKGTSYTVHDRLIGNAFPKRSAEGRVAYRAANAVGSKIVALWVHSIVDGLAENAAIDVLEGR